MKLSAWRFVVAVFVAACAVQTFAQFFNEPFTDQAKFWSLWSGAGTYWWHHTNDGGATWVDDNLVYTIQGDRTQGETLRVCNATDGYDGWDWTAGIPNGLGYLWMTSFGNYSDYVSANYGDYSSDAAVWYNTEVDGASLIGFNYDLQLICDIDWRFGWWWWWGGQGPYQGSLADGMAMFVDSNASGGGTTSRRDGGGVGYFKDFGSMDRGPSLAVKYSSYPFNAPERDAGIYKNQNFEWDHAVAFSRNIASSPWPTIQTWRSLRLQLDNVSGNAAYYLDGSLNCASDGNRGGFALTTPVKFGFSAGTGGIRQAAMASAAKVDYMTTTDGAPVVTPMTQFLEPEDSDTDAQWPNPWYPAMAASGYFADPASQWWQVANYAAECFHETWDVPSIVINGGTYNPTEIGWDISGQGIQGIEEQQTNCGCRFTQLFWNPGSIADYLTKDAAAALVPPINPYNIYSLVDVAREGDYNVSVVAARFHDGGIWEFSLDPQINTANGHLIFDNAGHAGTYLCTFDEYGANSAFGGAKGEPSRLHNQMNGGIVHLTAGQHEIMAIYAGKNPAADGWVGNLDKLIIEPVGGPRVFEAELQEWTMANGMFSTAFPWIYDAKYFNSWNTGMLPDQTNPDGAGGNVQPWDGGWANSQVLAPGFEGQWLQVDSFDAGVTYSMSFVLNEAAKNYDVSLQVACFKSCGIYNVYLDGNLVTTVDMYADNKPDMDDPATGNNWGKYVHSEILDLANLKKTVALGAHVLAAGSHTLTLEPIGQNAASTGMDAHIDRLVVAPSVAKFNVGGTVTPDAWMADYDYSYKVLRAAVYADDGTGNAGALITEKPVFVENFAGMYMWNVSLPAGNYIIRLKAFQSLSSEIAVSVDGSGDVYYGDVPLTLGDTNNDDRIDDYDLLAVSGDFGAAPSGFNGQTDLTGDNMVDDYDLLQVSGWFGVAGPIRY